VSHPHRSAGGHQFAGSNEWLAAILRIDFLGKRATAADNITVIVLPVSTWQALASHEAGLGDGNHRRLA